MIVRMTFRGILAFRCADTVAACGTKAVPGFTTEYEPEVAQSLAALYETELIDGLDSEYINSSITMDCSLYMGTRPSMVN